MNGNCQLKRIPNLGFEMSNGHFKMFEFEKFRTFANTFQAYGAIALEIEWLRFVELYVPIVSAWSL